MKRKEDLILNVKSLVLYVHLIYVQNWGQSSVAVTQPHCNDKDVGLNTAAARNEKLILGTPIQKVA